MKLHFSIIRISVALLVTPLTLLAQGTITAQYFPGAVAGGGGTGSTGYPYAFFVKIEGWSSCAGGQAYVKLYSGSSNEFMWTGSTWSSTTTYSASNQPVVNVDASGNWSGWIYAKHNDALGTSMKVRAAKVGATSTNVTGVSLTVTALGMISSGNGGWLVRSSSTIINKAIAAYAGGAVVGAYRSEDNGIAEGYSYGAGGFKIAVPAGLIDSLVSYHDDGSRDSVFPGPWIVGAGSETDAESAPATGGLGTVTATPSLIRGGIVGTLTMVVKGSTAGTITACSLVIPSSWTWSHDSTSVQCTGPGTLLTSVSGDTILVHGAAIASADSLLIQIQCAPPDTTATYLLSSRTGQSSDSLGLVSKQPSVFVYSTPLSIGAIKENDSYGVPLRVNQLVTVRGVVTVANEFGGPSYIQDNSAGLAVFGSSFSSVVHRGDEVIVSGLIQPFNGLTEIVNPLLVTTVSSGNAVAPTVVNAQQIASDGAGGVENYEGMLVRVNRVTVSGSGAWAYANYTVTDPSGSVQMRVDDATDLVGGPIPGGAFDMIGVVGQFVSSSPFIGGYQIMPRETADIITGGPLFASVPVESAITPDGFSVSWTTVGPGTSRLRFGTKPTQESSEAGSDTPATSHTVRLNGLNPATIYYVSVFSAAGTDTSFGPPLIVSTASPSTATEAINVYFNKSVNTALAWPTAAKGNQPLDSLVIRRIANAHRSIDVALYSLSGNVGTGIYYALVAARNRGVSVRVICEADNDKGANGFSQLRNAGVPLIDDTFDPVNQGAGLMHNKFFVIDGRGGAPDSAWVWTGSWNPTDPGTIDDFQNSVEIQDPALAGAYTLEFNEMWGSDNDVPNQSVSRFGARKTDNTPHRFVIGGRNIECYFSPSDHTTSHIIAALDSARHSIAASLLTITRSDIADAIIAKRNGGEKTRMIVDDSVDQGSQVGFLRTNGVDLLLKPSNYTGLYHHKYGIIDGDNYHWNGAVITGSHNWTSAAENSNNENLLVIHDPAIANQYLQEFAQRYADFGGQDPITVDVKGEQPGSPTAFALAQNYPNPFNPATVISGQWPVASRVRLVVYDILGREVAVLADSRYPAGRHTFTFDGSKLSSGIYFYRLTAERFSATRAMVLLR